MQGDWNFRLQSVYTVGILDFVFDDPDKEKTVVTEVKLMDTEKKKVFYNKLTFIYLQMPNFGKTEEELKTHFDKWLYVIKNLHRLQDRPAKLQERIFEKLFGVAEIEKFSYEERMAYEDSLKSYRNLKNSLDTAREEGEKIGMETKALQIAAEMLRDSEPMTKISRYTGLSAEEIEKIRKDLHKTDGNGSEK